MKIVHLSDLHFGTHDDLLTAMTLQGAINEIAPDLVIISGDFTQRALSAQFIEAQAFIKQLKAPCFCVPGNHDVPAYNLLERFTNPYRKYKEYISEELNPFYETEEVVIAGLNSARRVLPHWNWANGAISSPQIQKIEGIFDVNEPRWTICTFHHPVHKVDEMPIDVSVFGKTRTIRAMHSLKIDLVLTGHVHYASCTTKGDAAHQTVYLSASTALSWRRRANHENGFNVITFDKENMDIEMFRWLEGRFQATDRHTHRRLI